MGRRVVGRRGVDVWSVSSWDSLQIRFLKDVWGMPLWGCDGSILSSLWSQHMRKKKKRKH